MHAALGDRVSTWTTLNEPWCSAFLGYASGVHAPGRTEPAAATRAAHHLLLGHGLAGAGDPGRSARRPGSGSRSTSTPSSPRPTTRPTSTRRAGWTGCRTGSSSTRCCSGRYPEDVLEDFAPLGFADVVHDGDLDVIGTPIDVLGVNYYTRHVVTARRPEPARPGRAEPPGSAAKSSPW